MTNITVEELIRIQTAARTQTTQIQPRLPTVPNRSVRSHGNHRNQTRIYEKYRETSDEQFSSLVRLNHSEFDDLAAILRQKTLHKRGPKSKLLVTDILFCILYIYAHGITLKCLAHEHFLPLSTFSRQINWMKISLSEYFRERFRPEQFLYSPDQNTNAFKHVALIIDSTSIKIPRPSGTWAESIQYWDGKNEIYALKVEIAITNTVKPVAIFISPSYPGSHHDSNIHRKFSKCYDKFLQIQPQHYHLLHNSFRTSQKYYIMADKAYAGLDTGLNYEIPIKNPNLSQDNYNKIIGQVRVRIEQFFGRMKTCWKFTNKTYPINRESFDCDIANCVYLTNIISSRIPLSNDDIIEDKVVINNIF
jgi:hypothetical protein